MTDPSQLIISLQQFHQTPGVLRGGLLRERESGGRQEVRGAKAFGASVFRFCFGFLVLVLDFDFGLGLSFCLVLVLDFFQKHKA